MLERINWWRRRRREPSAPNPFLDAILRRAMHPRHATSMREAYPSMWRTTPFEGPGPRLSASQIAELEKTNSVRFPQLFREILQHVGDGGFGPGYGFLPMIRRRSGPENLSAFDFYQTYRGPDQDPGWTWPEGLLPLADWGCLIFSCLDCTTAEGAIVRAAPGEFDPKDDTNSFDKIAQPESTSLESWLSEWLANDVRFDLRQSVG